MSDQLGEHESVLRAIWPNFIKKTGRIDPAAFKPRSNKGEIGVSVNRTRNQSLGDAIASMRASGYVKPISGIASITVPECLLIPVHIDPDPPPAVHCQIYGDAKLTPIDNVKAFELAKVAQLQSPPQE